MKTSKNVLIKFITILAVLLVSSTLHAQENTRAKLAILPFIMNAPDNLSYLQEGVRTMLTSRIASRTGVELVGINEIAKAVSGQADISPLELGKALGADLVLAASITSLGPSLSIDTTLTRLTPETTTENFFASAADQGEIITAVDKLAAEISAGISGEPRQVKQADSVPAVSEVATNPTASPDQTLHPDRMFKSPVALPLTTPLFSPSAAMPTGQASRSQFLDLEIQVMDVGDVLGEGTSQVVLAEKQKVAVFRQNGGQLSKALEAPAAPRHVRIVSLCLADLNGNGRAEIYVSAISDNNPLSYAVEWDGKAFVTLYEKQRWHTRTINLAGKGLVLIGQQAESDHPVRPGIYQLGVHAKELVKGERLAIPETVNLFDFALGDFTGDGKQEIAVHNQDDDLFLYNQAGDVLWQGTGNYGYTKRYIGPADSSVGDDYENLQVPTRLVAVDLNGDGRDELLAMKNPTGLGMLMPTISSFVGGSIDIMAWDGITLREYWTTGPIGNYIASYQMVKNEGRLYIGLVSKNKGLLLSTLRSTVAKYQLANTPQ